MHNIDLWIAGGLLLTVVIVFVASRVGIVPQKSIPVVAGAVFGALGFMAFAVWRRRASDAQITELKRRIALRDGELTELQKKRKLADEELAAAKATLDAQLEAMQKERLRNAAVNQAAHDEIDKMGRDKVNDAFDRMIREEEDRQKKRVPAGTGGT